MIFIQKFSYLPNNRLSITKETLRWKFMSEEKQVFELLDDVKNLGEIITKCIEKGEMDNKLVANWTFDTLQLVVKNG